MNIARNAELAEEFRQNLAELVSPLAEDMNMAPAQRAAIRELTDYICGLQLDDCRLRRLIEASRDGTVHGLGAEHLENLLSRYGRTADDLGAVPVTDPSSGLDMLTDAAEMDAAYERGYSD